MVDVFQKSVDIDALVDENDQLYEQEILQQPYRNFASIKDGLIESCNFMRYSKYCYWRHIATL